MPSSNSSIVVPINDTFNRKAPLIVIKDDYSISNESLPRQLELICQLIVRFLVVID